MLSGTLGVENVWFVTEITGIDYLASLSQLTVNSRAQLRVGVFGAAFKLMMLSRRSKSRTRHCWQPTP
jgi:hypothetical protein